MACPYLERGGFFGDSSCKVTKQKLMSATVNNTCDTGSRYYDCVDYKKAGSCFITSSVCFAMGMPDDCDELMNIRGFRDLWLRKQPNGEADIKEYYDCAPGICGAIDKTGRAKEIYHELYETYILPCVTFINGEKYVACYELYKKMVTELKARFL